MTAGLAHLDRMQIAGYIPVAPTGFALPAYRDAARRGNAWYLAQTDIDGDRVSSISCFEPIEDDVNHSVGHSRDINVGDPWHDVFMWRDAVVVGTPREIYENLASHHDELSSTAPLSFLDLSLAAGASDTREVARFARTFLASRLGEMSGAANFREVVVRSGVALEMRRYLHRLLPDFAAHENSLDFSLRETTANRFAVDLTTGTSTLLGSDDADILLEALARFGDRIGVEIEIAAPDLLTRFEPISEQLPEPVIAEPALALGQRGPKVRSRLLGLVREIAVDLGTGHTRVTASGRGMILSEPSLVAFRTVGRTKKVLAVGEDAKRMVGKTPENIHVVQPLRDGAIVDLDIAVEMLKAFLTRVDGGGGLFRRPLDIILCVPSCSTQAERRVLRDAAIKAGASQVHLIDTPMAAAIGAGLPVAEPLGSMIVDIGSGVTQVAVISLREIAYESSFRVGGDAMDEALVNYVRRHHNLLIGTTTAERIKHTIGSAVWPVGDDGKIIHFKGRDLANGVPREIWLNTRHVAEALSEPIGSIIEAVRIALENTAPELSADLIDTGIMLTGGGALLDGLSEVLRDHTGLPVTVAEDPLNSVTRGLVCVLKDSHLRGVLRRG